MITDWKKEIAVAWLVQNEIDKLDTDKIWKYFLPKVAATEHELIEAEATVGHALDNHYREFLKCANGWRCFHQMVDLFGTEDLSGSATIRRANLLLDEVVPEAFGSIHVARAELLPIAVSSDDIDLFVLTRPSGPRPGVVIWFAGYEIDRFATFDDFFLAMIDYNRARLEKFRNGEMKLQVNDRKRGS